MVQKHVVGHYMVNSQTKEGEMSGTIRRHGEAKSWQKQCLKNSITCGHILTGMDNVNIYPNRSNLYLLDIHLFNLYLTDTAWTMMRGSGGGGAL
jgi:hypothetical protein